MDRLVFGRYARAARLVRMSVSPTLICGSPIGMSQHVRVDPSASPDQRWRRTVLLIDAMQQFARQRKMSLCFRNVVDGEGPLGEALMQRGWHRALEMPTTVMDVKWATFAEYRRALKRDHPKTSGNISREIRRARDGGIVFRKHVDDLPDAARLHSLVDAHYLRLNNSGFPFGPAFFDTLKRNLGSKVVAYVAMEGNDPIGVTVAVRAGDAVFLSIGGTDIARGRKTGVYFNNSYNVPIEDAIASGVRRIYCGKMMYDVKERRGFRRIGLSAYVDIPQRLRSALLAPAFAAQRARIQRIVGASASNSDGDAA